MEFRDARLAEIALDTIRVANMLERLGGKYALEADLNIVQQYMILSLLNSKPNSSMGDLHQNTLVTKQAITGVVDRLRKGGYVEVHKDAKDRRITRVLLTEKGEIALQNTRPKRITGNREAFSILSEEEIIQLSGILSKLVLHLKNKENIDTTGEFTHE